MENFALVVHHGGCSVNNLRGYVGGVVYFLNICDHDRWSKIKI